eukprot:2861552-Pleurochrysis_carterae.AAC.1
MSPSSERATQRTRPVRTMRRRREPLLIETTLIVSSAATASVSRFFERQTPPWCARSARCSSGSHRIALVTWLRAELRCACS